MPKGVYSKRISNAARMMSRLAKNSPKQKATATAQMARFHAALKGWYNQLGGDDAADRILIETFGVDPYELAAFRKRWGWRRVALRLRRLIKEQREKQEKEGAV